MGTDTAENLALPIDADRAAYVIYTSGSTGEPKGAIATHRNVLRLLSATRHWFEFGADDVWTLFHSIAFDFSVWELFGALLNGGRLVVVPYLVSRAPDQFHTLLQRERVTVLNQTPSAFLQLLAYDTSAETTLSDLRTIIFGGEALDTATLAGWFDRYGDERPRLVNMYGITETTVHVTYRPLKAADALRTASPIGLPIPDLYVRVLDPWMELVPPGLLGELFVGGAGLTRGYLNRVQLTAERFVDDPFQPGARLYRTGDRVRQRDGELEFAGRLDDQIKIRGFRIEPGEVAAVLNRHPMIAQAAVAVRHRNGEAELAAYYVGRDGPVPDNELRRHLQLHVQAHMIPRWFSSLARLPLTINGKLDYRSLPEPEMRVRSEDRHRASTVVEQTVLEIWQQALDDFALGPDDNVFDHGAHSVLAIQVRGQLERALDRSIPVVAMFQFVTAAAMATHLQQPPEAANETAASDRAAQRRRVAARPGTRRTIRGTAT
jgi:amino acid adenylation domain-containing protein